MPTQALRRSRHHRGPREANDEKEADAATEYGHCLGGGDLDHRASEARTPGRHEGRAETVSGDRPRYPAGEEAWSEKGSRDEAEEPSGSLVSAPEAASGGSGEGYEGGGSGATTADPGGGAGVAPPGDAPPLLSDTNESVVEEAEHGAAAEEELEAAADELRMSRAEARAKNRAAPDGGR